MLAHVEGAVQEFYAVGSSREEVVIDLCRQHQIEVAICFVRVTHGALVLRTRENFT